MTALNIQLHSRETGGPQLAALPWEAPAGSADVVAIHGAAPSPDDRIALLERLAELHESGALSAEEFQAEKRRVLGP